MAAKQKILGCASYSAMGFLLMFPLGMVFDDMNWPRFHSWALAHGSFHLAWPLLTLMCFAIQRVIERNSK
jgi:hypothetical protein